MVDRIGNLLKNRDKCAREATEINNSVILFVALLIALLLMSNTAGAEGVTYYLNATSGVNIGADGLTNVIGSNQNIPPTITALMDKTGSNSRGALTNDHPHELYNHSRWYFTTDYSFNTKINANPAGKVLIYASSGPYPNLFVRLYDYDSSNGIKTLIGSSSSITLIGGATNTAYSYTISSPTYIVPLNHRLMLQFDFDPKTHGNTNERVYANKLNSYLNVTETPVTYNITINSTPSSANIKAGSNFTYNIMVNNTGTTNGNYSLNVSDSNTLYFRSSVLGNSTLFVPAGSNAQTTLNVSVYEGAPKDEINTATVNATSIENPFFTNITQTITTVTIPITYNVTINSTPSTANIPAGANFTYNITVNNSGTTDGNYSLSVFDSDTTNFSFSLGMTPLFIPAGGSNQTTLRVTANGTAPKDAVDTTILTATSIEDTNYSNITEITTTVSAPSVLDCAQCHGSYSDSLKGTKHNQTKNPAAPTCTSCHKTETLHTGFIVNGTNTCITCHKEGMNGFNFSHRNATSPDCTQCHFANSTTPFVNNTSIYTHDHNLTVEHNYNYYNKSGTIRMPLKSNGGAGEGMFPAWTCTQWCHGAGTSINTKIDNASITWVNSKHAQSLAEPGHDNNVNCAKCKSPLNYNALDPDPKNTTISDSDWQGIQCRICHDIHWPKYSNSTGGFPLAFYNGTASSQQGITVYDAVHNATELCEKCHSGSSHDSKFGGTHKDKGLDCASCHLNTTSASRGGFNNVSHSFEVKNAYTGVTGCEVCHTLENHTFQYTSNHTGKVECVACHDQTFTTVNATGYAVSNDGNYGLWKETPASNWTTAKKINTSPGTWPLHNISKSINCNKCHGATSVFNGTIAPFLPVSKICAGCHLDYSSSVLSTNHNKTINENAPECTDCHTGYEPVSGHTSGNKNYTVNENNTCRNCHIDYVNGFREAHTTTSSDCTMCHFANTTKPFSLNASLFTHDHNMTVEHSYYEYTNGDGMPLAGNVPGTGVGMFPQYTCSLTCHATRNPEKVDKASSSWLNSSHANSRFSASDSKNNCAKCKSPTNYNDTLTLTNPIITQQYWDGIQCRVCHNLHYRNASGISGYPVAFYNATASSYVNYSVYEPISNNTQLCEKCHEPGGSHDSKFAGSHKTTLSFTCTSCHMNSSFNKGMHEFEVKNATSGITGCEVCHNPVNHSFQFTSKHAGKVDCIACHDQTFTKVNATGYAVSSDNYYGLWKETPASNWTTAKKINTSPGTWPLHNISKSINCNKCHGATSVFNGTIAPLLPVSEMCAGCHFEYSNSVLSTNHNKTKNVNAPECTGCHTGYEPVSGHTSGNKSYTVNESNTCRNCHIQNESGFFERHTGSSDCTQCHFANTTRSFDKNASLFSHDHNLTVERNFYQYNQSGMPVRTNSGTGVGMFPYYTCTLTCHKYNATTEVESKIDEAAKSWLNSAHAQSLHMSGDNKQSCSKCKSPANFNASANQSSLIDQADWQGIQCRTCHNLHDRKFPNNTGPSSFPIAFYNSTASSLANYPVYEQVDNATVLCQNCHSGTSHDSKFEGTHKDTANFTCINCHMNSSFNNELHTFEVKNTTSNVTGCEVCHEASKHSVLLCKGKIDCVGCHDQTVQRNSTGYAVSPDNKYGIYKDNATGNWTTYKESKGSAVSWPLHNISKEVTCEKCKGTLSVYSGPISRATGTFCERCHYQPPNGSSQYNTDGSHGLHKAKGYGIEPETSCDYCHSTGGRNESGHPGIRGNADVVTNGSVSIGIVVKNNATGSDDTCTNVSCHSFNLSQGARVGTSTWNTSTSGLCNQCHSTQISGVPPTGSHAKHNARNVSCSTCHGNDSDTGQQAGHRNGQIEINLTKLASNGTYVSGTCSVYCHDPNPLDLNSSTPTWNLSKIVCGDCHTLPPTIFKTRHGNNHPEDPICDDCHGAGSSDGTNIKHRDGEVETFELKHCLSCHEINGSAAAKIDSASFGMHRDVNNTDGGITYQDCLVCHFNISGMFGDYKPLPGINVYVCRDCHLNQTVNSTKVAQHIPGSNLSVTTMNCEDCHVNSINIPDARTTIINTLGKALHYGTRTNLVKPTAGTYNTACNICHNSSVNNITYGAQNKQIYTPHTGTAKCNMCHIPSGEADTLHNSSLSMPVTVSCIACHTTYASKYKASNITGTFMDRQTSTCNYDPICHPIERNGGNMDTLARHNINMTMKGKGGYTDTVYLNGNILLPITKGTSVVITSKVNDTAIFGGASRVGGAEYYIDNDPGEGKGIPMEAVDGFYDALDAKWENVTATLNTSSLSNGEHKIFVRGVDIGNQWSAPKNATLIVQSEGYINVSSNVPGSVVIINGESNTTDANGNYSWRINYGIYSVIVRKDPAYYENTTNGILVTPNNITNHTVLLALKPFGTIGGIVRNV